jgi:F-type H+-transporting ATPase subunit b
MNPIVTTVAQIVNFLIFAYILHRLLLKPVRNMMKERRDEMEAGRREAEQKLAEAEEMRTRAEAQAAELEASREKVMTDARDAAEAERKKLLDQARDEARSRLERYRRVMEQERTDALEGVQDELKETITDVARAVLRDADASLTDRAIERLGELLDELSDADQKSGRDAVAADEPVPVRFAGTLSDDQLDAIRALIAKKIDVAQKDIELELTEAPELLAGIEVALGHVQLEAHWRSVIDEALAAPRKQEPTEDDERTEDKDAE